VSLQPFNIFAAENNRLHGAFSGIIVDLQKAVVEGGEYWVDGLGQSCLTSASVGHVVEAGQVKVRF